MKKILGLGLAVMLAAAGGAAELTPQKNIAAGRVTLAGGKAITADVDDYQISIYGVSEAGEKVRYSPVVKNGQYKQKLVPGQYAFNSAKIKVRFGDELFLLPLEPVGKLWNKNQDAEEGIVQDFVWKPTGAVDRYASKPNPNNHTHWYGMSVGMQAQGWRNDINKAPTKVPAGTKLVFTLTPLSQSIDGRDLSPITIERTYNPDALTPNDDLNDLPPANYEITGVAKLPDGSSKPILFQGRGNYPGYVTTGSVPLEMDKMLGGYWKQLMGWVVE